MPKPSLWSRIGSAFERSDIGMAGADADDDAAVQPTATRYASIRDAVQRRIVTFLRRDLVSHLEIGFNERFVLHYIEITADSQGEAALVQFLHEFSPKARVEWVKKLLGPAVGRQVSVDQFQGLDREFSVAALAETDPFEDSLNQAATALYRVVLHGRWEIAPEPAPQDAHAAKDTAPVADAATALRADAATAPRADAATAPRADAATAPRVDAATAPDPAAAAPPAPLPSRAPGPRLYLGVRDAKPGGAADGGARVLELEHYPAVLGSSAQADVEISGYYVSARHCTLHWDGGQLWLADHSTNGTWVDGERARRGSRVLLANGAVLGFGRDHGQAQGRNVADPERYPEVRLQLTPEPRADGLRFTPVAPPTSTPVAPALAFTAPALVAPALAPVTDKPAAARQHSAPLAVLAIADATGHSRRDVLKLPYSIGRGSAQDYVVPEANQGVSREHLVIESIDADGALLRNGAVLRNGTSAAGQPLPERFVWRFGEELLLGEKWSDAPPVRISLQRSAPAP